MQDLRQNSWATVDSKRLEWLLLGLIALLLVLVMALALVVLAGRSERRAGAPAVEGRGRVAGQQAPVRGIDTELLTAKSAYAAGLELAQEWAADAQLWQAQATWPGGADLISTAPGWVYTFYSPSQHETALVNAAPGKVSLARTQPATSRPALVAAEKWEIDSEDAIDVLMRSGGRAFLSVHEEASMMLTLRADDRLRWQATLIDESGSSDGGGRQAFRIEFDAVTGQLIMRPVP